MSLLRWLGKANPSLVGQHAQAKTPGLPNPNLEEAEEDAIAMASANAEVDKLHEQMQANKRKRGPYHQYDGDLRLKMARSIDSIGLAETGRKFTTELGHNMSLNALKSIQQSYRADVKRVGDPTAIKSLAKGAQGRPTMLPGHIFLLLLAFCNLQLWML